MANIKFTVKEDDFILSMKKMKGEVGGLAAELNTKLVNAYKDADLVQKQFNKGLVRAGESMKSFGQSLTYGVFLPLAALSGVGFKAYAELQAIQLGLEIVEGSSDAAGESFKRIRELAKQPGLGFKEAAQGYTNLRAVGFAADFTEKALTSLGNALAVSGKGKFEFNNVLVQFQQMASKGKVLAEDLKPIINSAPIIAKTIKDLYGSVDSETISDTLSKSGKTPADFINDIVDALSKIPSVAGGAKNAIENFGDNMFIAAANIGSMLDNSTGATDIINSLGEGVVGLTQWLKELNPQTKDMIVYFGGLLALMGPITYGLGSMTTGLTSLLLNFNPLTLAVGAYVAAMAGLAIIIGSDIAAINRFEDATKSLAETTEEAKTSVSSEILKMEGLMGTLQKSKKDTDAYKMAKDGLIAINPAFEQAINGEKGQLEAMNKVAADTVTQLVRVATAKKLVAQQSLIADQMADLSNGGGLTYGESLLSGLVGAGKSMMGMNKGGSTIVGSAIELGKKRVEKFMELSKTLKQVNESINKDYADVINTLNGNGVTVPAENPTNTPAGVLGMQTKALKEKVIDWKKEVAKITGGMSSSVPDFMGVEIPSAPAKAWDTKDPGAIVGMGMGEKLKGLTEAERDISQNLSRIKENSLAAIDEIKTQMASMFVDNVLGGIESMFSGGKFSFAKGMRDMLGAMGSSLITLGKQALIASGAIENLKKLFGTAGGTGAAIGMIASGIAIKAFASKLTVPKLAKGGLAMGPQLAMIGDNASGKEAVIPFERMGEFLNMAGGGKGGLDVKVVPIITTHELMVRLERVRRNY